MNVTRQTRAGGRVCPFCDIAADVPHETQAACIEALHDEIGRMRGLLQSTSDGPVAKGNDDPSDDPETDIL
jgi:hypothetical protein